MLKLRNCVVGAATLALGAAAVIPAHAKDLTLCWAAWDPANALVELSVELIDPTYFDAAGRRIAA